jgi:hypothetical protein
VYDIIPQAVKSDIGFEFLEPWFRYHYIFSQYTYPPTGDVSDIVLSEKDTKACRVCYFELWIVTLDFRLTIGRLLVFWVAPWSFSI